MFMKQYITKKITSSALMSGVLLTSLLHAEGDLSQKANDPTAPKTSITFTAKFLFPTF